MNHHKALIPITTSNRPLRYVLSALALGFSGGVAAQAPHPGMPQGGDPKQQLLAQLHDVITPEAVSWWPLSPGWWLVMVLGLSAIAYLFYWLRKRFLQSQYRRQALKILEQIPQQEQQAANYACQVTALLKRCFFAAYPQARQQAAKLHGDQWAQVLVKTHRGTQQATNIPWAEILYNPQYTTSDIRPLQQFAKQWIKQHKALTPAELNSIFAELAYRPSQAANKGAKHVSI